MIETLPQVDACRGGAIAVADFHTDCVEDICAGGDPDETVCITLDALASACMETGTPIDNLYRIDANCSKYSRFKVTVN